MASKAAKLFTENAKDIEWLLELYVEKGGTFQGRRRGLEVLNKSAIVPITSFWEAYCEDLASEALGHIVKHGESPDSGRRGPCRPVTQRLTTGRAKN